MQSVCAILYHHLWPVWLYRFFPHYLINDEIFEKSFEHKMCILIFSTHCLKNFPLQKEFSEISSYVYTGLHVKYPSFLSGFNGIWIFLTDFQKIHKHHTSWKSVQWKPSCYMGAAMTNPTAAFCSFTNLPKIPSLQTGFDQIKSAQKLFW